MKSLIFLILTSCGIDTPVVPDCKHTISVEQGKREDKLHIKIISDLDYVWITVQDYPPRKVGRKFYDCISYSIKKDECFIRIEAEQNCEYIY